MAWALALALAVGSVAAFAVNTREQVRKSVEMSMLVTGTIDIEKDGRTGGHRLDHPEKLPPIVARLVGQAVPEWRFEPVKIDGNVVRARASMGLRVVAKKQDDGNYTVAIRNASFGEEGGAADESVRSKRMPPPKYPEAAYLSGIEGTVYLILKVGRQGAVDEVVTEQVNLKVLGNERQMQQGRELLARAAASRAKGWTFDPPIKGRLGE